MRFQAEVLGIESVHLKRNHLENQIDIGNLLLEFANRIKRETATGPDCIQTLLACRSPVAIASRVH